MKSEKQYNKSKALLFIICGILSFALAFIIVMNNLQENLSAANTSVDAAEHIIEYIKNNDDADSFDLKHSREIKTIEYEGHNYMGVLSIPSINLTLPIIADYDFSYLTIAPCLYYGNPALNNAIICAHNYKSHFGPVRRVPTGTQVFLSTVSGDNYQYIVENIELIGSRDGIVLVTENPGLTLFTCTNGGGARYAIRCSLVNNDIDNLFE